MEQEYTVSEEQDSEAPIHELVRAYSCQGLPIRITNTITLSLNRKQPALRGK